MIEIERGGGMYFPSRDLAIGVRIQLRGTAASLTGLNEPKNIFQSALDKYLNSKVYAGLLIFVHVILQLRLAQLVEGDNDQGHKDVDKEEGKDDEEDDVEDGLLGAVPGHRALVLVRGSHRVLENSSKKNVN